MKSPKTIYILISIFCIFAVAAGIYAEFFVSEQDKPGIIVPNLNNENEDPIQELTQEEIKTQFASIFNNNFNKGDYDTTNIDRINANEDIVYTVINMEEKKDNYEINIKLPAINMTSDAATSFNNITQTIFANKASEILNNNEINKKCFYNIYV